MTVTYTNRKGITYYLCRGINKRGRPYYYFAREVKGEPVEETPVDSLTYIDPVPLQFPNLSIWGK